ncbi:MAG: lipopolysaccharide heptosyltransferase II [Acidobacteria bacterium]|nr:lipopolysaccharide heptosyltransferase II [Acidobacteriota bacterium]
MTLEAERIERVVVRGANWVGDALMTVPALRELRRLLPRAHVTLATRAWARDIFDGADFIDDLLVIEEPARGVRSFLRQVRQWRARRFDLALLFPNSIESALVAFAARVPARVGYATESRGEFLTHALETPAWRSTRHEVFYYLNLVAELGRALGVSSPRRNAQASRLDELAPQYALEVSDARRAGAAALLEARGVDLARPLVALCPGSTNSRAKRWQAESYAALADRLAGEAGATVLLIGAREELDVTKEVVSRMRREAVVLTGETSLAETAAILSLVGLLVTNDTGPAHLASALGRPTLVIFGPTNPLTTRPFSPVAEIVRRPPDCAPCMLRDCPIDHRCMTAITADEVFARAVALLGQDRARVAAEPFELEARAEAAR